MLCFSGVVLRVVAVFRHPRARSFRNCGGVEFAIAPGLHMSSVGVWPSSMCLVKPDSGIDIGRPA
jgi:hypothetical protein